LKDFYEWFDLLCSRGPAFGYFPQPSNCFVVVSPPFVKQAKSLFGCLGVKVVTGHWFLGGDIDLRQDFVQQKVHQWCGHVHALSAVVCKQPQAAYTALTQSLQFEWTFSMPGCGPLMMELERCLSS